MKKEAKDEFDKQIGDEGLKGKFPQSGEVHGNQFLAVFRDGKLLIDKQGIRKLRADFSVQMTDAKVRLVPKQIRGEWAGMKAEGLVEEAKIDAEHIPVQVVSIRSNPEGKTPEVELITRLERVMLRTVRTKSGNFIELRVSVTAAIGDELWAWLRRSFGTALWIEMQKAQGELLDEFLELEELSEDKGKEVVN